MPFRLRLLLENILIKSFWLQEVYTRKKCVYHLRQMCITKHSPEIQLKVCDTAVKLLMNDIKVKRMLSVMGFHQIGLLLTFDNTPSNRYLLISKYFFCCILEYFSFTALQWTDSIRLSCGICQILPFTVNVWRKQRKDDIYFFISVY